MRGKKPPSLKCPNQRVHYKSAHNGSTQSVLIRQCTECDRELASCQICKRGFAENESMIKCPHCKNPFHKNHIFEYIKIKGECPVCKEELKIDQVQNTN